MRTESRQADRVPIPWLGRYHVTNDPAGGWRPCRGIDTSRAGATIELLEIDEAPIGEIVIDVHHGAPSWLNNARVTGQVRNSRLSTEWQIIAGVEFTNVV